MKIDEIRELAAIMNETGLTAIEIEECGARLKLKRELYAGIDKVRFRRPVRPGDTLETEIRLKRKMANLYVCTGEARVNGELCSSGEFQFVVT